MKNPEILTCHQLWRRYHNADKTSDDLRYKWKHAVSELHDTEYRIDMVKESLRKEYEKLPAKESNKAIPLDVQKKIFFLRHTLSSLINHRKETHFIIIQYKKRCEAATTRANRYKMAYHRIKVIASKYMPKDTEKPGKFIDEFTCLVLTEKNGGLNIQVKIDGIDGIDGIIKFKY